MSWQPVGMKVDKLRKKGLPELVCLRVFLNSRQQARKAAALAVTEANTQEWVELREAVSVNLKEVLANQGLAEDLFGQLGELN